MSGRPAIFAPEHAAAFEDPDVVAEYELRAPYPPETFDVLQRLIDPEVPTVLDLGSGTGLIARALAPQVERVDAVDPSEAMIADGRRRSARIPNVRWIHGRAEDAPLGPRYGLATAGASVHWMEWEIVLPRLAGLLSKDAVFAILYIEDHFAPWHQALKQLFEEYSVYGRTYQDVDVVAELERRSLYGVIDRARTAMELAQPVDDYVRALHSHASLARSRIGVERSREFDERVRSIVSPGPDGHVHRHIECVVWGRPLIP